MQLEALTQNLADPVTTQDQPDSINWGWFQPSLFQKVHLHNANDVKVGTRIRLSDTSLWCRTDTEAESMENRLEFIRLALQDIIPNCPKDEEITMISFGANNLLMEYIIGLGLIKNGYQKISFLLIDSWYQHHSENSTVLIDKMHAEFRKLLGSAYHEISNQPFPEERIRFLGRAQEVEKHFIDHSNVVLMECLPVSGNFIRYLAKYGLKPPEVEEVFMGGRLVKAANANAMAFLPLELAERYKNRGLLTNFWPKIIEKAKNCDLNYCLDWGCKIYPSGKVFVGFFGGYEYIQIDYEKDKKNPVYLAKGYSGNLEYLPFNLKRNIENNLQRIITVLRKDDPQRKLSQAEITELLQRVKQQLINLNIPLECFFLTDEAVELSELMSFLSNKAGHHYRKAFYLRDGKETPCEMGVNTI